VISPLGVALALVRDVVERTIVDPSAADLARIRREAIDAAVAAGAAPDRVDVVVEVDTARNRVRATASGATALVERDAVTATAGDEERINTAAEHLRAARDAVWIVAQTTTLAVIASERAAAVVDERGVVRLVLPSARVRSIRRGQLAAVLARAIDEDTTYGDVGRALPDLFVLRRSRIAEFTGMADADQLAALAEEELAGVDDEEPIVVLTVPRRV
jgi:N-methylhydantoinase A